MRPIRTLLAATALASVVSPVPPAAGAAAPTARLERATVELVLIEAYATDRHDQPIRDLKAEDFVLLVDGKVEPIASLEHREAGPSTPAPSGGSAPGPAAGGSTEARGSRTPRRFVLFFDDETSAPQGLTMARTSAERFLADGLTAGDQVAMVSIHKRLTLLHDFSDDRESLRGALRRNLEDRRRISSFDAESRQRTEEVRGVMQSGAGGLQSAFALKAVVREEVTRYRRVLEALSGLVDSLAAWPGYKAIVIFGDGISEYPGSVHVDRLHMIPRPVDLEQSVRDHNVSMELERLGRVAAGAGVTLHTVQTSGLAAGHAGEHRADARRSNALESLALNTGGSSSSSNDLMRGLVEADQGSRAYYAIGYAPPGPPDGQYHTVRLRVKRSGVRLRYRTGFTRFLPADAHRRAVQAAHLLPELQRELRVSLSAVPGPAENGRRITDLVVHVPPGSVLFLPEAGRFSATVEAGFVAFDGETRETLRLARRFRIALDPRQAARGDLGINLVARVHLPVATRTVTTVVTDTARGALGAARLVLALDSGPDRIHGLSLYSMTEKSLWLEMEDVTEAGTEEATAEFKIGPALKTDFEPGEDLACGFRMAPGREVIARMILGIRTGDRTIRTIEVASGPNGETPVTVPLSSAGLDPGDYLLVVQALDGGPPVECGSVAFRIGPRAAAGGVL